MPCTNVHPVYSLLGPSVCQLLCLLLDYGCASLLMNIGILVSNISTFIADRSLGKFGIKSLSSYRLLKFLKAVNKNRKTVNFLIYGRINKHILFVE